MGNAQFARRTSRARDAEPRGSSSSRWRYLAIEYGLDKAMTTEPDESAGRLDCFPVMEVGRTGPCCVHFGP
jgi:hypothetical protein